VPERDCKYNLTDPIEWARESPQGPRRPGRHRHTARPRAGGRAVPAVGRVAAGAGRLQWIGERDLPPRYRPVRTAAAPAHDHRRSPTGAGETRGTRAVPACGHPFCRGDRLTHRRVPGRVVRPPLAHRYEPLPRRARRPTPAGDGPRGVRRCVPADRPARPAAGVSGRAPDASFDGLDGLLDAEGDRRARWPDRHSRSAGVVGGVARGAIRRARGVGALGPEAEQLARIGGGPADRGDRLRDVRCRRSGVRPVPRVVPAARERPRRVPCGAGRGRRDVAPRPRARAVPGPGLFAGLQGHRPGARELRAARHRRGARSFPVCCLLAEVQEPEFGDFLSA
jgi:hypothetical protein